MPQGAPGLTLSFASSVPTSMRVSFYLDHQPERMALQPEVAALLDMYEADRASLTTALWGYIKLNDLQDEDKRHVKCDARMSKVRRPLPLYYDSTHVGMPDVCGAG